MSQYVNEMILKNPKPEFTWDLLTQEIKNQVAGRMSHSGFRILSPGTE